MKGQPQRLRQVAAKVPVGVGLVAPKPMMQVSDMEDEPQFPAPPREGAQQRHRISSARKPNGNPETRG